MNIYPGEVQTLLLKAALLQDDTGRKSFAAWTQSVDLNDVDWASQRIIPLLFENIQRLAISSPSFDLLKGVHRYWWFRNNRNLGRLKTVVSCLTDAGVSKVMLLKGSASGIAYYSNLALRPMADIDIAVQPQHTLIALNTLLEMGFTPKGYEGPREASIIASVFSRLGFYHHTYGDLDLHWEILGSSGNPDFDANVWKNAVPREFNGQQYLFPCAADLLLHTIDHGLMENVMQAIWWVADAHTILEKEQNFDWRYFFQQASLVKRVGLMVEALDWLDKNVTAKYQSDRSTASRTFADRCYAFYRHRVSARSRLFQIEIVRQRFCHYCDELNVRPTPARFIEFLIAKWGLSGAREIPARAIKALRK